MSRATHPLQCNAMMNKKTNKPDSRGNKYEENHTHKKIHTDMQRHWGTDLSEAKERESRGWWRDIRWHQYQSFGLISS